ncbi:unnamed protein product [Trichobilharzia szidati]|nr:unnamed protein product [Trichobilharzia szidati]
MTKKSSASVIRELKELTELIHTTIPDVPGKHRLVRMCQKEITHFESLPSESVDDAVVCSNLPYFKAITTLANAYGNRLVDLLCRYRLPLDSIDSDTKESGNSVYSSNGNDYSRCEKQDSLFVELVCTQSDEDVDEMSRFRTCNGNASEACLWAPALWIKVVTRDSSRLNNAWRGEASSKHAACLGRQAEELVLASHWYQRGQPQHWIRVIVHWLPQSPSRTNGKITDLDEDLREYLEDIGVTLITGCDPWIGDSSITSSISSSMKPSAYAVSLKDIMFPLHKVRQFLNQFMQHNESSDFKQFKYDSIQQIFSLFDKMSNANIDNNNNDNNKSVMIDEMIPGEENDSLNSRIEMHTPMDAVLQRSALWSFSCDSYNHIDELKRINLDVSALIAFVSELSQFNPTYSPSSDQQQTDSEESISCKILECLQSTERRSQLLRHPPLKPSKFEWLIASEAEVPVLLSLDKYLRGKVPIVCLSAVHSFLNIVALISGPGEWKRAIQLISRLVVIPDLDACGKVIPPFGKPKESRNTNNYLLTQRIMEVGNTLEALTITSNAGFLRSVRKSNLRYSALLLPARALTEKTPRVSSEA